MGVENIEAIARALNVPIDLLTDILTRNEVEERDTLANRGSGFTIRTNGKIMGWTTEGNVSFARKTSKPTTLTIAVTSINFGGLGPNQDILIQAEIQWSSGASLTTKVFDVSGGFLNLPLVAQSVNVRFRAVNAYAKDSIALAAGMTIQGTVSVSDGIDGLPTRPTDWTVPQVVDSGTPSSLVIFDKPSRVLTVNAYRANDAGTTPLFILLFDRATPPTGGESSIDGLPLDPVGNVSVFRYSDTHGMANGLCAAVSTTAPLYTATGTTAVVKAEELIG